MSREQVATARSYCFGCPVQTECLVYALHGDEDFGIWGGFTPEERRRATELTGSLPEMLSLLHTGELLALVVRI